MMVAPGVKRRFNRAGAHVRCPRVPPRARRMKWLRAGSDAFFIVHGCLPGLEDVLNLNVRGWDDFVKP